MTKSEVLNSIENHKGVAVLRLPDASLFEPVCEALYEGGIRILEITLTTPSAVELIARADRMLPEDMLIGTGTVLNGEDVSRTIDAGASFVVSPIVKKEIIETAINNETAVMCGALTPTEIQKAWELGTDVVKVFPADLFGPNYLKSVRAPLPHLRLMPTGGVSLTNGGEWLDAGAFAVGAGSALVPSAALEARRFDEIRKNAILDRKSTRLNSSHVAISYAVFCV